MKTLFQLRLPPGAHAASGASACFVELDRLEGLLSRHQADSDITTGRQTMHRNQAEQ